MFKECENTGELKEVNVLETINIIISAWEVMTPYVISNYFHRARFMYRKLNEEFEINAEAVFSERESKEVFIEDWIMLHENMKFTISFKKQLSVDNELYYLMPCIQLMIFVK